MLLLVISLLIKLIISYFWMACRLNSIRFISSVRSVRLVLFASFSRHLARVPTFCDGFHPRVHVIRGAQNILNEDCGSEFTDLNGDADFSITARKMA